MHESTWPQAIALHYAIDVVEHSRIIECFLGITGVQIPGSHSMYGQEKQEYCEKIMMDG